MMADERLQSDETARVDQPVELGAPPSPRGGASGWYAVESDNTIRGWCRDRSRPEQRFELAIVIDGTRIATVLADRVVERLAEMGDGDGRFGFVHAIPTAFYDGLEHETRVEIVAEAGAALKSKRASFAVRASTAEPRATLHRIGGNGVDGILTGPAGLRDELDVWLDGRRLTAGEFTLEWNWGERQARPFRLELPDSAPLDLLGHDLIVAYPGTDPDEAGSTAALVRCTVAPVGEDGYEIAFGPGVALPPGQMLFVEVHGPAEARPLARQRLEFVDRRARFTFAGTESQDRLRLRLLDDHGEPIGSDTEFARSSVPRRLLSNGAFARWDSTGPDGFTSPPDVVIERGFYTFPPSLKRQFGLSGTIIATTLDPTGAEQSVLASAARPFGGGDRPVEVGLAFLARASRPMLASLRLIDGEGRAIAVLAATLGLRWQSEHRVVTLPAGKIAIAHVELVAQTLGREGGPIYLELAGLHCGDPTLPDFSDGDAPSRKQPIAQPGANLVVNAALTNWPSGLAFGARHSRFELAEGWTLANPGGAAVQVAAVPAPAAEQGQYGLSLAIAAVEEPVRLEVLLDADALSGPGEVAFTVKLGEPGSGSVDRWEHIDRISIVRRTRSRLEETPSMSEAVVALVARRVAVTRAWETCRFDFTVSAKDEAGFDIPSASGIGTDHLLVFELRRPMTLAIAGLSVRLAPPLPAPRPAPLAFEDRAIRAQLEALRGVEHWRGDKPLRPAVRPAAQPASRKNAHWAWRHGIGSVEVAICVHDAADETLACLGSLAEAGGVPHTVRIVDDASGEDTRQRIAAFVADRPWMALDPNPGHLGYTVSANRAVGESRADWVILLNSDTIVTPGWMEGLLEVGASDPRVGLVGPVSNAATYQSVPALYDGTGKWAVNALPPGITPAAMAALVAERSDRAFPEVPLLNGFCTLIRRTAFVEAGGFDERAFPHGYGEGKRPLPASRQGGLAPAGGRSCLRSSLEVAQLRPRPPGRTVPRG